MAAAMTPYPAPLDDAALAATWRRGLVVARPAGARRAAGRTDDGLGRAAPALSRPAAPARVPGAVGALARPQPRVPGEVELALWFHDAVLRPTRGKGSQRSPQRRLGLRSARAGRRQPRDAAARALRLIEVGDLATHTPSPLDPDARLLVDIDLAILGSPAERFERYDQDVRMEQAWTPGFHYQEARAQVLQSLLDRPRLFYGEHAAVLFEAQARINLAAALSRLAQ